MILVEQLMDKRRAASTETITLPSALATEAAEAMARADGSNPEARAAYARLLVEQSKSFGIYVRERISAGLKQAG